MSCNNLFRNRLLSITYDIPELANTTSITVNKVNTMHNYVRMLTNDVVIIA